MLDDCLVSLHDWFLGSIWKRFDKNFIWVIYIYDHHIFVPTYWLDGKSSGLVGVYLPCEHLWLIDCCLDIDVLIFLCFVRWLLSRMWVFRVQSLCPSAVSIESGRNLAMLFSVKNGYVDRFFFRMSFRSVFFVGLPMLWCKKLKVSLMVPSGRIALIRSSTCFPDGGVFSACGNLHILVAGSL